MGTARAFPLSNSVLVSMRLSLRQALLERASWTPEAQNAHVHVHGRPSLHSSFQVFRATLVTCEQRAIILTQPMASSSTNRRQSAPDLSLLIKMPRCFKGCSQHRMSYERSLKKTPTFRRRSHGAGRCRTKKGRKGMVAQRAGPMAVLSLTEAAMKHSSDSVSAARCHRALGAVSFHVYVWVCVFCVVF